VAAAFLAAGLVDEVIAYVAPALLGSGRNAVAEVGVATIDDALRFELVEVTRVGDDVRITMRGKH
jgi:diaminohydroxyphosphoribosylaminopyrimidine deaminase/5-amino-6-(5-phosphoribosylamino)uracil reductase